MIIRITITIMIMIITIIIMIMMMIIRRNKEFYVCFGHGSRAYNAPPQLPLEFVAKQLGYSRGAGGAEEEGVGSREALKQCAKFVRYVFDDK
jgi:hypothetical protein